MTFLTVNGIQLYYQFEGVETCPPMLLIHGLGSSGSDWKPQIDHFSSTYRIILVDLRCHGQSDKPPGPVSISMFAQDVIGLLDHFEIKDCHVVGISMGGMVAFKLACFRPDLVKSLGICNSVPELRLTGFREKMEFMKRLVFIRIFGMRLFFRSLSLRMFPNRSPSFHKEMINDWVEKNEISPYVESMKASVNFSVLEEIKKCTKPILYLISELDFLPIERYKKFAQQLPNCDFITVQNRRHGLPVEDPDCFNRNLQDFLNKSI